MRGKPQLVSQLDVEPVLFVQLPYDAPYLLMGEEIIEAAEQGITGPVTRVYNRLRAEQPDGMITRFKHMGTAIKRIALFIAIADLYQKGRLIVDKAYKRLGKIALQHGG